MHKKKTAPVTPAQNHGPAIRAAVAEVAACHQATQAAADAHRQADLAERDAFNALDLARADLANRMLRAGLTHVRAEGFMVTRAADGEVVITRDHFVSVE